MLKGSIVALITPFDGENLSEDNYIKLINYHLENGTNGVEIDHYKVLGGDHSWPSLNADSNKGNSNGDIDSDRIIWEFFSRFDINGLR